MTRSQIQGRPTPRQKVGPFGPTQTDRRHGIVACERFDHLCKPTVAGGKRFGLNRRHFRESQNPAD